MTPDGDMSVIGRAEQAGLRLVFGGPVLLWVWLARLVGVRVVASADVDDESLSRAEAKAHESTKWFAWGLAATTACVFVMYFWSPIQAGFLGPIMVRGFDEVVYTSMDAGLPRMTGAGIACVAEILLATVVGIVDAVVIGGVPIFLLRGATVAAAPAVSIALARRDGLVAPDEISRFPRVAYAVDRVLGHRQ
jgi:hypothetical protein